MEGAQKSETRRKSVRVPVKFDTQITHQTQKHQGDALNLSVDGMCIHTPKPFVENDRVLVLFKLPTVQEPMKMWARVVWGRAIQTGTDTTFGIGIQFEKTPPSQRKELVKFIQGLLKS